ncbi:MAG: TolC family protein [Prevotella sp.]|nr:TolC family protein [Prevotella sp.]MDY5666154.1 TolC family protein [Alloprevotella sp.]
MWKFRKKCAMVSFALLAVAGNAQTNGMWTLKACIDYAMAHNVQLLKSAATEKSASVDVSEAKAGLLPSLSGAVTQGVNYRPFQESGGNFVNGGIATSAADKATQNGSYGINAQWVVWNGGKNKMNVTNAQYTQQLAAYDTQTQANKIKEQIAQLYVQILYMVEAEKVNRVLLAQDSTICARGQQMVSVGSMSKADLAQLQSQVSQGRYNVVNVQTQIADAKVQLKQLLEIPASEAFDVQSVDVTDAEVLNSIPGKENIYASALDSRPEVKRSLLAIEQSQLSTKIAKSGYMPTISLSGGLGDSHMTGSQTNWAKQMRNNFSGTLGVTVSIPIFDNRKNKSAVERAKVAETTAQLDLQDTQKQLYQTIETYWLNATNSQAKYVAAKSSVESLTTSYELMTEQFNLGLKNIAELLNSRANLLNAQQTMLQDKYTALLNRNLLSFYAGDELK